MQPSLRKEYDMRFYTVEGDRLKERVWCDNPTCPAGNNGGRDGIRIAFTTVGDKHFCHESDDCREAARNASMAFDMEQARRREMERRYEETLVQDDTDAMTVGKRRRGPKRDNLLPAKFE